MLARADLLVTAVPLPPEKFVVKASELKKGVIAINLAQHANLEPAAGDVDLDNGVSEVARLLRCAIEREASLEAEEKLGRQAAGAAMRRAARRRES